MTKAIVLAAGQGTRLRPITNDRPKCLVPLVNVPLLERQDRVLRAAGITDIHIITGYRADQIEKLGYQTTHNVRFKETNMVASLFCAMEYLSSCDEDLVIAYGDIVYQLENLEKVMSSNEEITLMIDENWKELWSSRLENPLDDAETLKIDGQGFVTELGKVPESYDQVQGQYTGLIKIRKDMLPKLISFYQNLNTEMLYDNKDFDNMYMTSFLQTLIDANWKVKAAVVEGGWLEVDTVEDLQLYESLFNQGKLSRLISL